MSQVLKGKVALVTGGSRGIGAASAIALADLGADVAITYVSNFERADAVVNELESRSVRAKAFQSDQGDVGNASKLIEDVVEIFGKLDILVLNAAGFAIGSVEADDTHELDRLIDVNVRGVIATLRAGARVIGDDGRIIAMSSALTTRIGGPGLADYTASKAAVIGFVKGAARDLAPRRITVNALSIGAVDTDMNPEDGPISDWLKSLTALGRYARPEEIGAVVAFVASPGSSFITGSVIPVDGGGNA